MENDISNSSKSRRAEAGSLAESLLTDLETKDLPIEKYLMMAIRIARLTRDTDAQTWLNYEISGYPLSFTTSTLGTCEKYARSSGRITLENKFWPASLPEIEAIVYSDKLALDKYSNGPRAAASAKDYLEYNATKALLEDQRRAQEALVKGYRKNVSYLSSFKSSIHSYAADTFIAIQLGNVVEDIFSKAQLEVERFIQHKCPKGAEKLLAVSERMNDDNAESRTAALTSCRRLLMEIADSVFPARSESYVDSRGKSRQVNLEAYKNRILAYVDINTVEHSGESVLAREIEHIAARLDAVYDRQCKGVHSEISTDESRLAIISTYLVIAEIAKIKVRETTVKGTEIPNT